ncbi:hypothetical protein Sjap_023475 [Stephania japonica]|uniref:Protein kinase domain-containing protein n=1 Tax=Stephania japonica TaxID=461633 RepID=A0AAP0HJ11_9MAGN
MVSLHKHFLIIYSLTLICVTKHIYSQQFYDNTNCTSQQSQVIPGSNYLCNASENISSTCDTFIVYRVQQSFDTLSAISNLFNANGTHLFNINNLSESSSLGLYHGREIIVPVNCLCNGRYSQAILKYNYSSKSGSLSRVACEVYEGLVKAQTLADENSKTEGEISVPLRCACPNKIDRSNGVQFLVTYPILESDNTALIGRKFGVHEAKILDANSLEFDATIFPQTTLLIPTEKIPALVSEFNSTPVPTSTIPLEKLEPDTSSKRSLQVRIGVGLGITVLIVVAAFGIGIHYRRKWHPERFQQLSTRSSTTSSFSPDLIDGMSKLKQSLISFSLEELQIATRNFCESSAISSSVYKGKIGGSHMAIEKMDSVKTAQHIIDILTRINHLNIVKLEGFCYGSMPYLIYKFAENGRLRDCLSNAEIARAFTWKMRTQIAFDVAVGLHYIHYCTRPSYFHRNINSRNIMITIDWRAEISGFRWVKTLSSSEVENAADMNWYEPQVVGNEGYLAPEYFFHGLASPKVDVFAFGVILLELLSSKDAVADESMLKDSVGFLQDGFGGSPECLDKLKEFMDPALEENYQLGNALCLALLAKGCLEEDPRHRPTMNDVLKTLSRMV